MTTLDTALDALFAIAVPDPMNPPNQIFQAVEDVMVAHGRDDIADLVAEGVKAGKINTRQAQAFLGVASWSGTDNGSSMQHTLNTWLRDADDTVRVGLALHHDSYPFIVRAEMVAVLTRVAQRFAEHRTRCEDLIARRPGAGT